MCKISNEVKCSICYQNVKNNQHAIMCSNCDLWSHTKCNYIDKKQYKEYQLNPHLIFYCLKCKEDFIPFMSLNDHEFDNAVKKGEMLSQNITFTNFSPSVSQKEMFDKLNKEIDEYNTTVINNETESDYNHPITCNYYDVNEFKSCKFDPNKNFSIMHLNIHSIQLHIDELRTLLSILDSKFDIIAISESKLKIEPIVNIEIIGYQKPCLNKTEANKGYNNLCC